ncbi:MAG: NusG domain II-containing protein [Sphaerochaetaceae bacterium]|nr:NusG domain II-containing protein [Sphaerochaetaceae bacterium]
MKVSKVEIFFIILILLLSLLTVLIRREKGANVRIETEEQSYLYSLSEDRDLYFDGPLGVTQVKISNGRAYIVSSPCPNHTCYHGYVETYPDTIVCLPNHVSLYAEGKGEVDATSF